MTITMTAPYLVGDQVEVQHEGAWVTGYVAERHAVTRAIFGLAWMLVVDCFTLPTSTPGAVRVLTVYCDDNGRNHTRAHGVRPPACLED